LKGFAAALVLAGVSVCLPAGASAFAASTGAGATVDTSAVTLLTGLVVPIDPTKRTKAQETAYRDQVSLLEAQGKLTPSMMTQMGLRRLTLPTGPAPATEAPAAVTDEPSASPMSCSVSNPQTSATAISLATPTIVLNGSSQGYEMYANASYTWSSPPEAPSTCVVAVGGVDGFALALDISAINDGVSFWACNYWGLCGSNGYLETNSQYGGGWALQDYATSLLGGAWGPTYSGTLTYAFRFHGGLGCVQAFSKYAHDWNSTSINGFSIGPWSIGVQWSSSSSNWTRSSQAGRYGC